MDFDDDNLMDDFETIVMTDEETGDEIEFSVIDSIEADGETYMLVVETQLMDDNETDAVILKKTSDDGENFTYALVEDDAEFDRVADLFSQTDGEYRVEID